MENVHNMQFFPLLKVFALTFFRNFNRSECNKQAIPMHIAHVTKPKKLEAFKQIKRTWKMFEWKKNKEREKKSWWKTGSNFPFVTRPYFCFMFFPISSFLPSSLSTRCMHRSSNALSCTHEEIVFIFMGHYITNRSTEFHLSTSHYMSRLTFCWTMFLVFFFTSSSYRYFALYFKCFFSLLFRALANNREKYVGFIWNTKGTNLPEQKWISNIHNNKNSAQQKKMKENINRKERNAIISTGCICEREKKLSYVEIA